MSQLPVTSQHTVYRDVPRSGVRHFQVSNPDRGEHLYLRIKDNSESTARVLEPRYLSLFSHQDA